MQKPVSGLKDFHGHSNSTRGKVHFAIPIVSENPWPVRCAFPELSALQEASRCSRRVHAKTETMLSAAACRPIQRAGRVGGKSEDHGGLTIFLDSLRSTQSNETIFIKTYMKFRYAGLVQHCTLCQILAW